MSVHQTANFDLRPGDGWFTAECECGWTMGPFPDAETMVDALMDHAADAATAEALKPIADAIASAGE